MASRYSDYPDHPLCRVPQEVLDAARHAMAKAVEAKDVALDMADPIADMVVMDLLPWLRWDGSVSDPHTIGPHDGELFRALLGEETNESGYLGASVKFLVALTDVPIAWMKMTGLRFEAYVYSAEDGESLCRSLMLLGAKSCAVDSFDHWHDGMTHMVKGRL